MLAKSTSTIPRQFNDTQSFTLRSLRTHTHTTPRQCLPTSVSTLPRHGCISSSRLSSTSWALCLYEREPSFTSPNSLYTPSPQIRYASSSSKWISRQSSDHFTREAKLLNLKSRAAFKLLQINERYRLLRPGMTVVDLGYAPGSWSQVAIDLVRPGLGRVVGVDVIPIQPPKGVNGIQGNFLSPEVQGRVREFLLDETRGKLRRSPLDVADNELVQEEVGYLDQERAATSEPDNDKNSDTAGGTVPAEAEEEEEHHGKCVDVVLSDMMMNTTGNKFRDHAGSMDLCHAALHFSYDTLKVGGHFVCKFYQGAEDKAFEARLRAMFTKVHREKPESSRSESRETFFVALKRLAKVDRAKVF